MSDQLFEKIPFYYEFQADFVVLDDSNEIKFFKGEIRRFIDLNPIIAREEALAYYQNFLDVVMQSIGKPYQNDRLARRELINYFGEISDKKINIGGNVISINNPLSCKIGVYLIQNTKEFRDEEFHYQQCLESYNSKKDPTFLEIKTFEEYYSLLKMTWEMQKSFLIHGIQYFNGKDIEPLILGGNLWEEYLLYEEHHYDVNKYHTKIEVYANDIEDTEEYDILITPYDWEGYNVPHSSLGIKVQGDKTEASPSTLMDYINNGESKTIEFKPAIFYNHTKRKQGSGLPCAIPICAFLNYEGGLLCVGVNDDKTIQGIDADLSLCTKANMEDELKKLFDQMIYKFFPPFVHIYIETKIVPMDDKKVFLVVVRPAQEPVFMKIIQNDITEKVFYIRREASNQKLGNVEEFYNYVKNRWFMK